MASWWKNWAIVDIVLLGSSIIIIGTYLLSDEIVTRSPGIGNAWIGIGSAFIGAWLGVRLIGLLISRSAERNNTRRGFVEEISRLATTVQQIGPHYYEFELRSVRLQLEWFKERKRLETRRVAAHFRRNEIELIDTASDRIDSILQIAERCSALLLEIKRLQQVEYGTSVYEIINRIRNEFDHFLESGERDCLRLTDEISRARRSSSDEFEIQRMLSLCNAIESEIETSRDARTKIDQFGRIAYQLRSTFFEE